MEDSGRRIHAVRYCLGGGISGVSGVFYMSVQDWIIIAAVAAAIVAAVAVSYTHLDVYKRQGGDRRGGKGYAGRHKRICAKGMG